MLKTNTKKAKENIKKYIIGNADFTGYAVEGLEESGSFEEIAAAILAEFEIEKNGERRFYKNRFEMFEAWCMGLPSILDTCYYLGGRAVEDLGDILEETAEEKAKFKQTEAEKRLTYLVFRELEAGEKRSRKA